MAAACGVQAELELPAVFSDSMVIQRNQNVQVWGWASAGSSVSVTLADQNKTATADGQGRWSLKLGPLPAGGPFTLTVSCDGDKKQVTDILVGEVWLCSGQSNMAMTVSRAANAGQEAAAADFPEIRMFRESSSHALEPQQKCAGRWLVCSPDTVGGFSATAYFFGRELHKALGVPVGLVNSSVGGTSIESWTSMSAQSAVDAIAPRLEAWNEADRSFDADTARQRYEQQLARWENLRDKAKQDGKPVPRKPRMASQPHRDRNFPSNLYNGKINPLVGYTIKGAIWYQGENSSGRGFAHLYGTQLETLISDWRSRWGQGDFPFAWVQLPNFRSKQVQPSETSGWVLVQEGMLKTLRRVANTGMAITIDVGEANDIHPKDKQTVGSRLATWALHDVYEQPNPTGASMGPLFASLQINDSDALLTFDQATQRLVTRDGEAVQGFAVAGEDRVFHWADAQIEGNRIRVSSSQVARPVAVRYSWAGNPLGNIYNMQGLPMSPFRTDQWPEDVR
jgi:sialate O-acetylesterase